MTSHGCAGKAVHLLKEHLPGEIITVNIETSEIPDLTSFQRIIIGGSIRIGSIQKRIRKFCEKNMEALLARQTGLFICCMFEGETALEQLKKNFPEALWKHAASLGLFGGELEFSKLNAFERMLVQQVANISVDVSKFSTEAVRRFAGEMSRSEE